MSLFSAAEPNTFQISRNPIEARAKKQKRPLNEDALDELSKSAVADNRIFVLRW